MISVLLPTTGRPERAARVVQTVIDTTEGHDVEVVCTIDNDPETVKLVNAVLNAASPRITWTLDSVKDYRGCSRAWNDALGFSQGDPVVFAADDLVFENGWLDKALEALATFEDGWGMVAFNDGHWDGNQLGTHYLLSRRFIVEVLGGVIAWDFYKHSFNDAETCARAKAAGRYVWASDAVVRHDHWLFGSREQDATDTRRLPDHANDERVFRLRSEAGFPNDGIEPVITA